MREEHWLRVFDDRVLRRIFRPKREEVTGEWRKLYNEEFNDLYCSPNIILVIRSGGRMWHAWWTGQVNTLFWWEAQRKVTTRNTST